VRGTAGICSVFIGDQGMSGVSNAHGQGEREDEERRRSLIILLEISKIVGDYALVSRLNDELRELKNDRI
jgi:hypothetical protein